MPKVLSIRQPFAYLILAGHKTVENRSWPTNYRGRLYIQASAAIPRGTWDDYLPEVGLRGRKRILATLPPLAELPRSAILGSVDLVDCVVGCAEKVLRNPWAEGPECWIVANPQLLATPFPCKGKLLLWEAPAGFVAAVGKDAR